MQNYSVVINWFSIHLDGKLLIQVWINIKCEWLAFHSRIPCLLLLPLQSLRKGESSLLPYTENICPVTSCSTVGKFFVTFISAGVFRTCKTRGWLCSTAGLFTIISEGWVLYSELLIPLVKSTLGSWVPAGLMHFLHSIQWSWCFLYAMCILKHRLSQVEHLLTQPCKDSSRFLASTEGDECFNDRSGWNSWDLKTQCDTQECEGLSKFSIERNKA